jgi:hypothetical protein
METKVRALTFDEIKERILATATKLGLVAYAVEVLLNLGSLERTLKFCLVPKAWKGPLHHHHARVEVYYHASQAALANDPEALAEEADLPPDEDKEVERELEVQVEYHLVGPASQVSLSDMEAHVKPRMVALNRALGGEPRQVYYTVATDYEERNVAVRAQITDRICLPHRPHVALPHHQVSEVG